VTLHKALTGRHVLTTARLQRAVTAIQTNALIATDK